MSTCLPFDAVVAPGAVQLDTFAAIGNQNQKVIALYPDDSLVRIQFSVLTLRDFRPGVRIQCRQFLQREKAARRPSP